MTITDLPLSVQKQYNSLSPEGQLDFNKQFNAKKKSTGLMYVLWLFLGFHYPYIGKWGMFALYWLTGAGFFVWMFIDMFRIPSITRDYNEDLGRNLILQIKMLES